MKTKTLMAAFLLLFAFGACKTQNQKSTADNSQTSLDWAGVYHGVVPCADCEGIETVITLNNDNTYLLQTKYLGKDSQIFETNGTFAWDKKGTKIILNGITSGPTEYLVGENKLIQLDTKGKQIKGDLAANYELAKAVPELTERYWKLIELNGNPVQVKEGSKEPHIILRKEENRVNGNGGCNGLMGTYNIDGEKIKFSKMAMTMMACPNMDKEYEFTQTLEKVETYKFEGDKLVLFDTDSTPLAKFEVVYLR